MSVIASSMSSSTQYTNMLSKLFDKTDSDGDGSVSKNEFISNRPSDVTEEMAAGMYANLDTSGSGSLSKSGFISALESENSVTGPSAQATSGVVSMMMDQQRPPPPPPSGGEGFSVSDMFSSMDSDGDGSVSQAEFLASKPDSMTDEQATQLFNAIDTQGTGSITEDQLAATIEQAFGGPRAMGGMPPPPPPSGGGASGGDSSSETFSALDTNQDGTVSLEEFLAGKPDDVTQEQATNLFNSIDSEGTGAITQDQFTAAFANGPDAASGSTSSESAGSVAQDLLSQLMEVIQNFNNNYVDTSDISSLTDGLAA